MTNACDQTELFATLPNEHREVWAPIQSRGVKRGKTCLTRLRQLLPFDFGVLGSQKIVSNQSDLELCFEF
jgi:hypothetical protein